MSKTFSLLNGLRTVGKTQTTSNHYLEILVASALEGDSHASKSLASMISILPDEERETVFQSLVTGYHENEKPVTDILDMTHDGIRAQVWDAILASKPRNSCAA